MMRSGCGPAHSSRCQSFHARSARETELGILALREDRAREAGDQRREAQRCVDAVEVHVGDARVDVVAAAAHLVEARRLHAPLVLRPADDGVEPDLRVEAVLVDPGLACRRRASTTCGARSASASGTRPSNRSAGSMRWSSTEMRMCCRSRGVGSGSSAIPDDYGRFWPTVNAICVKTAK